jgi:hypothetical protein
VELLLSKERILKDHALQISLKQRALQVQKLRKQNGKRESSALHRIARIVALHRKRESSQCIALRASSHCIASANRRTASHCAHAQPPLTRALQCTHARTYTHVRTRDRRIGARACWDSY